MHLQHGMKRFLASITLTLFDSDRLRRAIVFNPVKVQMKTGDLLESLGRFNKLGIAQKLHVASYLEMILLLADKRVIRVGKIEALVCVNAIMRHWPVEKLKRRFFFT